MGQLIEGFRVGILFPTASGAFRNGGEITKEQRKELSEAGYTLSSYNATPEEQESLKYAQGVNERLGLFGR